MNKKTVENKARVTPLLSVIMIMLIFALMLLTGVSVPKKVKADVKYNFDYEAFEQDISFLQNGYTEVENVDVYGDILLDDKSDLIPYGIYLDKLSINHGYGCDILVDESSNLYISYKRSPIDYDTLVVCYDFKETEYIDMPSKVITNIPANTYELTIDRSMFPGSGEIYVHSIVFLKKTEKINLEKDKFLNVDINSLDKRVDCCVFENQSGNSMYYQTGLPGYVPGLCKFRATMDALRGYPSNAAGVEVPPCVSEDDDKKLFDELKGEAYNSAYADMDVTSETNVDMGNLPFFDDYGTIEDEAPASSSVDNASDSEKSVDDSSSNDAPQTSPSGATSESSNSGDNSSSGGNGAGGNSGGVGGSNDSGEGPGGATPPPPPPQNDPDWELTAIAVEWVGEGKEPEAYDKVEDIKIDNYSVVGEFTHKKTGAKRYRVLVKGDEYSVKLDFNVKEDNTVSATFEPNKDGLDKTKEFKINPKGDTMIKGECKHDFDWKDFIKFRCKKCGVSFWQAFMWYIFAVIGVIVVITGIVLFIKFRK